MKSHHYLEEALFQAIEEKNQVAAFSLINLIPKLSGPSLLAKDQYDRTFLFCAVQNDCRLVAEILLTLQENQDDIIFGMDSHQATLMWYGAKFNHFLFIKELIKIAKKKNTSDPHFKLWLRSNGDGDTPLHAAAQNHPETVKLLIEQYEQETEPTNWINHTNRYGDTALHVALQFRSIENVILLLNSGADVMIRNNKKVTPFNLFCEWSHSDQSTVFQYLVFSAKNHLLNVFGQLYQDNLAIVPPLFIQNELKVATKSCLNHSDEKPYRLADSDRVTLIDLLNDINQYLTHLKKRPLVPLKNRVLAVVFPVVLCLAFVDLTYDIHIFGGKGKWSKGFLAFYFSFITAAVITSAISFVWFRRNLGKEEERLSPKEWQSVLKQITHVLHKLKQLELLEEQMKVPGKYLSTPRDTIRVLEKNVVYLQTRQKITEAIFIFNTIQLSVERILADLNCSNKPIFLLFSNDIEKGREKDQELNQVNEDLPDERTWLLVK